MTKMRPFRKIIDLKEHAQTYLESRGANSTLLYYISQSFGYDRYHQYQRDHLVGQSTMVVLVDWSCPDPKILADERNSNLCLPQNC